MLVLVREGAHPLRRHVEDVAGLFGAVGNAPRKIPSPVDKKNPRDWRLFAQQLNGEQGAARTAADDGDVESGRPCHISTSQPSGSGSPRWVSSVTARKARSATAPRCSLRRSDRSPQVSSLTGAMTAAVPVPKTSFNSPRS